MKKKILALLMASAMALSLAGCGGEKDVEPVEDGKLKTSEQGGLGRYEETEPGDGSGDIQKEDPVTAEDLIKGIPELDKNKLNSLQMSMEMDAEQDGQAVHMGMDTGIEMKYPVIHMKDMKMSIGMQGLSMDIGMEGWFDDESKISYQRITAFGEDSGWTKSFDDDGDSDTSGLSNLFTMAKGTDVKYVLEDRKDGEDYSVTWELAGEDLEAVIGGFTDSYADVSEIGTATGRAVFDGKTKELKYMEVESSSSADGTDAKVHMKIDFLAMNADKDLAIPQEVIDTAVLEGPDDDFGGFGGDGGFGNGDGSGGSSEPIISSNGKLENDGAGTDDVLDPLAAYLAENDEGCESVRLYHYDGLATLVWSTDQDNWTGYVEIDRDTGNDWHDNKEDFESDVKFEKEYSGEPRDESDSEVLFLDGEDGWYNLEYFLLDGEYYVHISVHTYDETYTEADMAACLKSLCNAIGVSTNL